jgi:hypothetical protein
MIDLSKEVDQASFIERNNNQLHYHQRGNHHINLHENNHNNYLDMHHDKLLLCDVFLLLILKRLVRVAVLMQV